MRTNDKGQRLCEHADMTDHPCPNVALWKLLVEGDPVGLTCEDCCKNGFKLFPETKKPLLALKSLATGEVTPLTEFLEA